MGLGPFAVVDVETSGLRPWRDHVIQIGVVTVTADGTEVDRWSTLVRLRRPWHRVGPKHIHGISRWSLRGASRPADAFRELAARLDGAVFTAHNAAFDAAFIERSSRLCDVPIHVGRLLCTLDLSRRLDPERVQAHGLADVCARYHVALSRHHDALADAEATAAVLPHLLAAHGVTQAGELSDAFLLPASA
ncbi:hypothetical protein BH24ACT5_BH24ACT5_17590 [soil metagenome]